MEAPHAFQISITKAIRTAQAWEAGLTFAFIPEGTGVLLVPVPKREKLRVSLSLAM